MPKDNDSTVNDILNDIESKKSESETNPVSENEDFALKTRVLNISANSNSFAP